MHQNFPFYKTFYGCKSHITIEVRLASFCPECGGELKFDMTSKNFICKSCGLFASREKIDEIRDNISDRLEDKRRKRQDDYLDWWQSSKKDKQKQ